MLTIERYAHLADGSVMPTQGSANPALTIMALSSRLADRLAGRDAVFDRFRCIVAG